MKEVDTKLEGVYNEYPTTPVVPSAPKIDDTTAEDFYSTPQPQTPPSNPAVVVEISQNEANEDIREEQDLEVNKRTLFTKFLYLVAFHFLNAALGIGGFCIIITGLSAAVSLILFFCVGLVLFQILTLTIKYLAKYDIALANMLTVDKRQHLRINPLIQSGFSVENGKPDTIWSRLIFFSSPMFVVTIYFLTLKFAMAILSCAAIVWGIGIPIVIIATAGTEDLIGTGVEYDEHPVAYLCITLGCWLVGIVLIPLAACLTQKLTKFCCADKNKDDPATAPVAMDKTLMLIDTSDK